MPIRRGWPSCRIGSTCAGWSETPRCRRRLKQAGVDDSDMLIAVTAFDETNLVACKIAADLFNVPTRIARVRNVELQQHPQLIGDAGLPRART